MRGHHIPISRPRYNPCHYRFPIPNVVWEYKLKPVEFTILSYICCCHSRSHDGETTSAEIVAEAVRLTVNTVEKHLVSLADRELITNEWSLAPALQFANSKNFFSLPNEIFLLNLPPSAFMVYSYLLLIEDRRSHTCHPSYNTIAAATVMAKNTVMKSIGALLEMCLITMERTQYFDKRGMKWNGNNLYTIMPASAAVEVFHRHQLNQLVLDAERRRIHKRQEEYDRRHPRTPLCAPPPAPDAPDPAQRCTPLCAR